MSRPYRFGKDKVHPLPLDASKASSSVLRHAPWSAPRGYTTSIPEEVAVYKASLPKRKPAMPSNHVIRSTKQKRKIKIACVQSAWAKIRDHFKGVYNDVLGLRQTPDNPNGDIEPPRLVRCICCLPR